MALNWAGISEDEFNKKLAKCNSEQERATLITNTLNGEYAEAGNKYLELNKNLVANREAQADWSTAMATAGEAIMPVSTLLMELGAALMESLVPKFEQLSEWLSANLPAAIDTAKVGFQWFSDNFPTIAAAAAGLLSAFMAFQGMTAIVGAISAMKAAYMALEGATMLAKVQQLLLNTAMKANPIILVVSLIAGLVAAFITAYTTSETFRNKVNAVFSKIKAVITTAMGAAKSAVSTAINGIKGAINGAAGVINGLGAKFQAVRNKVASVVASMRDAVANAINRIKALFNVTLSFPKIKLPHFRITGGEIPWGIGGQGTKPQISVDWYKDGAVFSKPTLFATPYGMKGVGEAGPEFVSPVNVLKDYVREAVAEANGGGYVANINVSLDESGRAREIAEAIKRSQRRNAYALGI